ncbi:MAG: 2-oxoacid:acceptor oxidoreductase subunit alpha [Rhodospirillaceae bacterium]|nr:2-oxoacid:acceptor oxidoreductase subunit alpha [Rhodospirillaceae bacterium]MBT5674138.1 2-oxoacid:acceptor oxidoreductase subunit alpha [Rhodospirillaceae bacterium]MBT7294630.1 2-oxoacid:acceptor oxidoreductase subunit alpha [Rhodospirillaceae bacterium]
MAENSREEVDSVVVRFAGDSGDGIQLTGGRFAETTAIAGQDLETFPDFPAEIRAPIGTPYGVSAFQINFGSGVIMTAGDAPDALVALNPAALIVNIEEIKPGGLVIVDSGSFSEKNVQKAGYDKNPLEDGSLEKYRVFPIDISRLTLEAVSDTEVNKRDGLRCKNMWTLGLISWMYDRDLGPTIAYLEGKFAKKLPEVAKANVAALKAGHAFGETAEMPDDVRGFTIKPADFAPGVYRTVTGTEATSWGLVAGAQLAGLKIALCSYPITPASGILHVLSRLKAYDVTTFQAEDEIAAVCAAIGASYGGALGVTSSSGPGIALKTEAIGLAIASELPLIVVNTQRAGPSTGMPTKTEQSDLYLAAYGRNADAPLIVLAAHSSADSFDVAIEAVRLATKYMTPVMLLSDTYIANAAEPWLVPDADQFEPFKVEFRTEAEGFQPYMRNSATLARPWVKPGTPGLEHRIGGLERDSDSGNVSNDPENHQLMTNTRFNKIAGIVDDIPLQEIESGGDSGQIVVVGWGSTYGPISRAVGHLRDEGKAVSHIHLRYINPLAKNLGDLLARFDKVLVPEMNMGQLSTILRDRYLLPIESLCKVTGKPFRIIEVEDGIRAALEK